jgi:hypothetical protein
MVLRCTRDIIPTKSCHNDKICLVFETQESFLSHLDTVQGYDIIPL